MALFAPRAAFARRLVVALAVLLMVAPAGVALAGTFSLFYDLVGLAPATVMVLVVGALGAVLFWPVWFSMRRWAGVPLLESGRRELVQAMDALPSTTDSAGLAECLVDVCQRLLPDRALAVLLPEQGTDRLRPAALAGPGAGALQALDLPRRSPLARALEREGRSLVVTRWLESAEGQESPAQSDTVFPLVVRGNLIGVLVVSRTSRGRGLSREEIRIVEELGRHVGGALENAELYGSLQSAFADAEAAQRELLALQRATTAAQSSLNQQEVLRNVCHGVIEGLDYQEAIVFLIDPVTRAVVPASAAGRLLTPKLRQRATTRDGRPLRLGSDQQASRLLQQEIQIIQNPVESILPFLVESDGAVWGEIVQERTVVSVPLMASGEIVGGMVLLTQRHSIAERELDSLRGFAAQAASAIVNARLYEDLREAYDDLRIAQDELVRSERLRTAGEVASGVAHDFNNILLSILTHAQLAGRQAAEPAIRHALSVIEQAALDGSEVVKRIQNLARSNAPETREPVDLNAVVHQSMDIAQPVWKAAADARGAAIIPRIEFGGSCHMSGVPSELREVFVNLILNATHAMPEGGTLTLRTYVKDGHCWGEVADTGAGMTEEVRRRALEPFFTTKGAAGSGLGLSIVSSIVHRHGGMIEIDSAPGRGTRIAVGFPTAVVAQTPPKPIGGRLGLIQSEPAHLKILVIDDDWRAREALQLTLEQLGHSVRATGDPQDALSRFLDGDYAAVLTDLNLENYSGFDVARAIKRMNAATDVVLVTGGGAQLDLENPANYGVDQVLTKPFTLDQIESVIEHVRARRSARSRAASA